MWKGIFDAKKPDLLHKLLLTDAREKDGYTGETVEALGSNEIKFLYRTHPDSRNALKKLKVPIPGSYIYYNFQESVPRGNGREFFTKSTKCSTQITAADVSWVM